MSSEQLSPKMLHCIDAGYPLLYLETFEEMKADHLIGTVAKSAARDVVEWDAANEIRDWRLCGSGQLVKSPRDLHISGLEQALQLFLDPEELEHKILVIKDGHHYFDNPRVISILKNIAYHILSGRIQATVIWVSPVLVLPPDLEQHITIFNTDPLSLGEIRDMILAFAEENYIALSSALLEEMAAAFKGLTEYEMKNIVSLAYASSGKLSHESLELILDQKRQVVKKSGILEMIQSEEDFDHIGGLESLKSWLKKKAAVIRDLERAAQFGVDMPKGVLIAGVPGCGKSLNAKAAAKLLGVPLLRLDMGRLLGKYVGESEARMRKAIALAEAISPCVLWIDELEKAFAGIKEGGGGAEVTTRLFGHFLTWMQEKKSAAFVVATANDILNLPPELMRKGRFDEIFYVGLPNEEERKKIFEIHIGKRRKTDLPDIRIDELVKRTKGYSGADIEGVVKESIEAVFTAGKSSLRTQDIIEAIHNTHSLSEIMREPLEKMTKEYETRKFKNASSS
ncbi:AAA family ATPase [Paenibacillus sp. y28]|uniref:AAA family ATPase n=1 Tax=Paenibacillus sp. y28 TaxID=3129110 RepID=UPI00301ADF9F